MNRLALLLQLYLLIGIVDQIEGRIAMVEITNSNHEIENMSLPTSLFPCNIDEGDFFYFVYIDGVTEIRCGEPPE